MYFVYLIENQVNKKAYIGFTNNLDRRWNKEHIPQLNSNTHPNQYLQAAWNKYGKESFQFKIYSAYATQELALAVEKRVEAYYRSFGMQYNLIAGGGLPPVVEWTEERKAKMIKTLKDRYASGELKVAHSEETRRKLSESLTGKKRTPEQVEKMRNRPCSEDTRKKLSEVGLGRKHTEESIQRMSEAVKQRYIDKPMTDETKEKLSRAASLSMGKSYGGKTYLAFDESKTICQWSHDSRCLVTRDELRSRLDNEWLVDVAIETPSTIKKPNSNYYAFGESKNITEWAKDSRCVVKRDTFSHRLRGGWLVDIALTTPITR